MWLQTSLKALSRLREVQVPATSGDDRQADDAITAAVDRGILLGNKGRRLPPDEYDRARTLLDRFDEPGQTDAIYRAILELVSDYPSDPRLQVIALRCLEAQLPAGGAAEIWQRLHERFPKSQSIAVNSFRRAIRFSGYERGWDLIRDEFPSTPDEPAALLLFISLLEELKDFQSVDICVDKLLEMPDSTATQLHAVVALYKRRGSLFYAAELAKMALLRFPNHLPFGELQLKLSREISAIVAGFPEVDLSRDRISVALVRLILDKVVRKRSPEDESTSRFVGRIILVGGSLGVGGAERQFAATAVALQDAIDKGTRLAGFDILGPVDVVCRSLQSRRDGDFFLAELERAGISVDEYVNFPDYGGRIRRSAVADIDPILKYLPNDIAEGTRKLTDVFRNRAPQVIHIWQDGAIISCLLAALIAEVPRIVLSVRTLPSIDRLDRYRPEYEILYATALNLPGVRLVANSAVVAKRYADWLNVDPKRVGLIHNGVRVQSTTGDAASVALAEKFGVFEGHSDFVVGTVMRFDRNKRPLLWVEVALAILNRQPAARFVLIGEGPLFDSARELVSRSGREGSFLFTGRTDCVGFWLKRMSVFLLLSLHESLPNGLIEAQLAGLPVVSTPAGGAAETFIDGETGTLLDDSEQVDVTEVADAVFRWRLDPDTANSVARLAAETARTRFSIGAMAEATVVAYTD